MFVLFHKVLDILLLKILQLSRVFVQKKYHYFLYYLLSYGALYITHSLGTLGHVASELHFPEVLLLNFVEKIVAYLT